MDEAITGEEIGAGPRCKATERERERGRETRWQKKETERKMGERVRHADRRGEEGERVSEEAKEAGEVKALLIS